MRDEIIRKAQARAVDGQVSCRDAHAIAAELGIPPLEVGLAINRATDLRFYRCQLGLFGYESKAEGRHKIAMAAPFVPPEMQAAVEGLAEGGAISCAEVWALAQRFEYPRLGVANIVEAMGLKLRRCQIGCF